MTEFADSPFEAAVLDLDRLLVKLFTLMPLTMAKAYNLAGPELQTAIAFAMLSNASTWLAVRVNATPIEGMQLRQDLQQLAANWILEHGGENSTDNR